MFFPVFFSTARRPAEKNGKNPLREATLHKKQKKKQKKDTATSAANGKFATDTNGGQKTEHRTDTTAPYSPEKNRQKTGNTYTRKNART